MIEAISGLKHWTGWFASGHCPLRQSRNSLAVRPKRCDRLLNHESLIRQVRRYALDYKECGEANARQGSPYQRGGVILRVRSGPCETMCDLYG